MKKILKTEGEVLRLLTTEGLTIKQACSRLKISRATIYRKLQNLKENGLIKRGFETNIETGGVTIRSVSQKNEHFLRLHNIQISVKIIKQEKKYLQILGNANKFSISGVTVLCYYDKLDIYTQEGINFYGETTDVCYAQAIKFFSMVYAKIENRLNIIIEKDQYLNKEWVRQHIAECNSEVAKEANEKKEQIRDKADDGKTWLLTDNSHKLNELEFVHPITAKDDTEKVLRFVRDMRQNPDSLTLSEITNTIKELARIEKDQAQVLLTVLELMTPQKPIIREEQVNKKLTEYIG
jgi:Fe2+ or Zn2+ uptake regulation protein